MPPEYVPGLQDEERLRAVLRNPAEAGTVLRRDRRKLLLKVPRENSEGSWFVKLYLNPTWKSLILHLTGHRGGLHEYALHRRLQDLGVPVPGPATALKARIGGKGVRSLYAVPWMDGYASLRDLVLDSRQRGLTLRPVFFFCLGRFLADIHARGVFPRDLNPGNLLCSKAGPDGDILLVDYEHVAFAAGFRSRNIRLGLSQLGAFLLPVSQEAVVQLCRGYQSGIDGGRTDLFTADILELSARRLARWKKKTDEKFDEIARLLSHSKQ